MPSFITLAKNVYVGPGMLHKLEDILEGYKNILLFVDRDGYVPCGAADFFKPLEKRMNIHRFAYAGKALPLEDLEDIYRQVKKVAGADLVIAVGGGTTIDVAKIISIAYSNACGKVEEVLKDKSLGNKIHAIFVPTTAGTGSETTSFAVVYKDKVKISVESQTLLPQLIILDPLLLRSLPKPVLHATILDALAQAIESTWAVGATDESRGCARQAIRLIMDNFLRELTVDRLEAYLAASHLAGKAINISKTTLAHSISYPLTAHFGIPHGIAVFLTLAKVAELNFHAAEQDLQPGIGLHHIRESFDFLFDTLHGCDIDRLVKLLHNVMADLKIDARLRDYGIKGEDLGFLAKNALTKGRSDNNPRKVDEDTVLKLLQEIY